MKALVENLYYPKILLTTKYIKLVEKIEFVAIALNSKHEAFIVYITSLTIFVGVHLFYRC